MVLCALIFSEIAQYLEEYQNTQDFRYYVSTCYCVRWSVGVSFIIGKFHLLLCTCIEWNYLVIFVSYKFHANISSCLLLLHMWILDMNLSLFPFLPCLSHCLSSHSLSCPRLSPTSENTLKQLYNKTVRNSTDPYKKAVYCVLGRCELNNTHFQVLVKTEDYMWLKVS